MKPSQTPFGWRTKEAANVPIIGCPFGPRKSQFNHMRGHVSQAAQSMLASRHTPAVAIRLRRQVSWLAVVARHPSRKRASSGILTGDQLTVAGTAMVLGSRFSPSPYSLIKAWGFAPQPPSRLSDNALILRHPVNQLRHRMLPPRHSVKRRHIFLKKQVQDAINGAPTAMSPTWSPAQLVSRGSDNARTASGRS